MTERTLADLTPQPRCPECNRRMTVFEACVVYNARITRPCGCLVKLFADGPEPTPHPVVLHP